MSNQPLDKRRLFLVALGRLVVGLAFIAGLFFLCAGTTDYWQAWLYIGILLVLLVASFTWLIRNHPQTLERRMRTSERQQTQRWVIAVAAVFSILVFILPGLDKRFSGSQVPLWLVLLGDAVFIAGYALYSRVIQVNAYASRVVEVAAGQKVISSGPYALVRHPMYLSMLAFFFGSALALASYWALIPAALMIPTLAVRLLDEEKTLLRDLPGYAEYTQKVRWHLIPGIW